MLKKLLTVGLALTMMFAVTACSSKDSDSDKPNDNNTSDNAKQERPFTESNGLIKYFTINDEKICLPETVGEYVKYLEKIGISELVLEFTTETPEEIKDILDGKGMYKPYNYEKGVF